jgi:phage-related minor tail protein
MSDERKIQLAVEVDATAARPGLAELRQEVQTTAASVARAGEQASAAMDGIGDAAAGSSRKVEAAERNLIGSIQRATAAAQAGSRSGSAFYESLATQRGVDPRALEPYLAQLRAVEAAQSAANNALNGSRASFGGVTTSAAQTAAALRGVPAQFTDIVTSIQGGQAPLTVFLQQGGQLRDTFGSAGAAARGLGGYVVSLMTPLNLVAAAVIGLAVAHHAGAAEAEAYGRSLALTNNAVGSSVDQMSDAARNIGKMTGSQREAAGVLAELAGAGQVAGDRLQWYGKVAVEMQRDVGRAAKETISDFTELGQSPVAALEKINDKYHVVTAAIYEQVKALEDQGKHSEAAKVAQDAYANAMEAQHDRVLSTLSDWENGWLRIKKAASGALDSAIDLAMGREATNSEKINSLLRERELIEKRIAKAAPKGDARLDAELQFELEQNKARINALRDKTDATKAAAKADAEAAEVNSARMKWDKDSDQYLSRNAQLERDIAKARNEGAAAQLSAGEIEKRIGLVRQKYSDIFNNQIESQIAALKRRNAVEEEVAGRAGAALASAHTSGQVNEEDYVKGTAQIDQAAIARQRAGVEDELRLAMRKQNSLKEQADLRGQLALLDEKSTSRQLVLENQLYELEVRKSRQAADNYANAVEAAAGDTRSLQQQVQAQRDSNAQIGLSASALAELEAVRLEALATRKEENADLAEGLDLSGRMSEEYLAQAAALRELADVKREGAAKQVVVKQAEDAAQAWKRASQEISSSLTDALMRGFEGGKSFAVNLRDTVVNMFKTMVLKPTIMAALGGSSSTGIGGGGGVGAAGDWLSAGKMLYSGFSTGISSSLGTAVTQLGNLFGSQAVSSFGAGMGLTTSQAATASSAYAAAGNSTAATGLTAGASAARAIPIVGWIIAGMQAANGFMKQGFEPDNGTLNPIGKAIGAPTNFEYKSLQWLGMNKTLANILSGASINTKLFGRASPKVESSGIEGAVSASGFAGNAYANILEKGGIFRSDKRYVKTADLSADQDASLDDVVHALMDSVKGFASTLGLQTSAIDGYNKQIKLQLGADEAQNDEAIAKLFGGIGDEISTLLLPSIGEFKKGKETSTETLQRIAGDFSVVDNVIAALGKDSVSAFHAVGVASLAARERLIDFAGGADALSQSTAFFVQNFLSKADQLAPIAKQVETQLAAMGLAGVSTRDQFAAVVRGLDLSTEAGAKQYVQLMALAPAFAQVHEAMQDVGEALAEAQLKAQQVAAALLSDVDNSFSVLQNVVDREKSARAEAHELEMVAINARIEAVSASISKIKSLSDSLHSTLDQLRAPGMEAADRLSAQAQIKSALVIAKAGGPLPDADSLKNALGIATQDASNQFSSFTDYQRDFYATASDIAALGDVTDSALDVQQEQLDVLEAQRDVAEAAYKAEIDRLDSLVQSAQLQIDAVKGVDTSVLSLGQALTGLQTMILAAQQNSVIAANAAISNAYQTALGRVPDSAGLAYWQQQAQSGASTSNIVSAISNSTEAKLVGLYRSLLGRDPDAAGLQWWVNATGNGASMAQITGEILNSDEYKKLHPFAVGTNYVPTDMPALIHAGERIIPAADNRELMARLNRPVEQSSVQAADLQAIRSLLEQIFISNSRAADGAVRTADIIERVSAGGGPLLVRVEGGV